MRFRSLRLRLSFLGLFRPGWFPTLPSNLIDHCCSNLWGFFLGGVGVYGPGFGFDPNNCERHNSCPTRPCEQVRYCGAHTMDRRQK